MAGRPHAEHPRVERFTLLLTQQEREELERLAVAAGLTKSEFVRARVFADEMLSVSRQACAAGCLRPG